MDSLLNLEEYELRASKAILLYFLKDLEDFLQILLNSWKTIGKTKITKTTKALAQNHSKNIENKKKT